MSVPARSTRVATPIQDLPLYDGVISQQGTVVYVHPYEGAGGTTLFQTYAAPVAHLNATEARVSIQGADADSAIHAIPSPTEGDLWIVTDADGSASSGDGLLATQSGWLNIGPVMGPRGFTGMVGSSGPRGLTGTGLKVIGSAPYATILTTPSPADGDMWLVSEDGSGAIEGDGIVFTPTGWFNAGQIKGPAGVDGAVSTTPGPAGQSAYASALAQGFVGSETVWLQSLQGVDGTDSTVAGPEGTSAYQSAVATGFLGTEEEWVASLRGEAGSLTTTALQTTLGVGGVPTGTTYGITTPVESIIRDI